MFPVLYVSSIITSDHKWYGVIMFYVYIHKRLSDKQVFYVGKGTKRRIKSKLCRNKHWRHVVNKHGFYAVTLKKFENENDAFEYEKKVIALFRKQGLPLTNIESGGLGGTKGRDMTACIEAARAIHKGKPRIHSEETKKKISNSKKGIRIHTTESKEKIRLANLNKVVSQQTRNKLKEANKRRIENGYVQKAWNKGLLDIYTIEQREQIRNKVKQHALTRLQKKGYYGGVGFHKYSGKWRAYIVESHLGVKKQISKGLYGTKKEAIKFLKLNYPVE